MVHCSTAFCPGLFGVWHLPNTRLLQAEMHDHAANTGTAQNRSDSRPSSSPTRSPCNRKEKGPEAALSSEQKTCDGPCHSNVGLQRRLDVILVYQRCTRCGAVQAQAAAPNPNLPPTLNLALSIHPRGPCRDGWLRRHSRGQRGRCHCRCSTRVDWGRAAAPGRVAAPSRGGPPGCESASRIQSCRQFRIASSTEHCADGPAQSGTW